MKPLHYIVYMLIMIAHSNLNADVIFITREGNRNDWEYARTIGQEMHMPVLHEISSHIHKLKSWAFGLNKPEKFLNKSHTQTYSKIFNTKTYQFIVTEKMDLNANELKIVGFITFAVDDNDPTICHLGSWGFNDQEINAEDFKKSFTEHFVSVPQYNQLQGLFHVDIFSEIDTPGIEKYRATGINVFGFVKTDDLRAIGYMDWVKQFAAKKLFTMQHYELDLNQLREQQ